MIIALFRILTLKKCRNYILVHFSYFLSLAFKKPFLYGQPYAISIEPSSICTLGCPECNTGIGITQRNHKLMSLELYRSIIDQISPYLFHLQLNFQGEAFLHPEIIEFISYARKKKVLVSISTHAQNINKALENQILDAGLNQLIISVDGITEETYRIYRKNASLAKTLTVVESISKLKKSLHKRFPILIMQFIVFRHNENQLADLKPFAAHHGFDKLHIKTAQFIDYGLGNPNMPKNENYNRYQWKEDRYVIKSSLPNACFSIWSKCVLTTDGEISPCCFDKNANFSYGNIANESLTKTWKNKKAYLFRKNILHNRKSNEMCCNCTQGLKL